MVAQARGVNYGTSWLRAAKKEVGPFGERVADFVDWWLDGIYHAERDVLRADWSYDGYVRLNLRWRDLCTFDDSSLTRLVICAHDRAIRVQLTAIAPHTMQIYFHPRQREGGFSQRHPTIQQAVERWSKGDLTAQSPELLSSV